MIYTVEFQLRRRFNNGLRSSIVADLQGIIDLRASHSDWVRLHELLHARSTINNANTLDQLLSRVEYARDAFQAELMQAVKWNGSSVLYASEKKNRYWEQHVSVTLDRVELPIVRSVAAPVLQDQPTR